MRAATLPAVDERALTERLITYDTSQPDGYCTQFNCEAGSCPSEAICVEFHKSAERFARRFCVRSCDSASDCRSGYVCIDPEDPKNGRDAKIHEGDPPSRKVCLP